MRSSLLATSARPLAISLCLTAALTAAACGSSGAPAHSQTPSATRTHASSTTRRAPRTSTRPTASTVPTVTDPSTQTTPALPGTGKPVVTIGDKNYTEQFVLGQLYLQGLRAQGFTVNISQNIGPPAVFTQALKTGSLAMYPEYLDTFNATVAHDHRAYRTQLDAYQAAQRWATAHGLQLLAPTPFSDTDAVGVTVAYAAEHHLRSLLDLRRVGGTLTLGGAEQLGRAAPGLPSLSAVYGVTPEVFKPLPVGDQYAELNAGTVQAAYVNTTDGQLASGDYRLLRDPKRMFGWGNVVPVVSAAALAKEGPAFAATIERIDAMLTLGTMRQLNDAVDVAKQDPASVAKQFLQTHGLLEPLAP